MEYLNKRVIAWFSCGATSAVATKLCIDEYPNTIPAYCDTGSEHPDNKRFIRDCESWFGRDVLILRSEKYTDIWDVFKKTRYLAGVKGARCTTELKKLVRRQFEQPDDLQVFGFDNSETKRSENFKKNNFEVNTWFPLIDNNLSKMDCLRQLQQAGIDLPAMYRLGYRNNNCIGCVKGQAGYWNKIRKDFPETFERMALMERELDVALCKSYKGDKIRKRVFLDELPPNAGRHADLEIVCGLFCGEF